MTSKYSTSNPFDDGDEDAPWGLPSPGVLPPGDGDLIQNALKKEKLVSEVVAQQEGLRALVAKIKTVQAETDKLAKENAVLDQYIANLAKR
ncbi:Protein of unknown function DUF2205, coiled-coil [Phaffia rhodozyma]|uniref:Uncharacterized protein n=1 Tax=Phaffia rhodozyma TaxID=264483 RepID=A0A0F7SUH2_PHARH|nr:Protein of unknown function DUF2205, coiled-coil [Phaffia rhodozyma]